jgi:hypothetical protein
MLRPEDVWPVDDEYADIYSARVAMGRQSAANAGVNIVAIARNAMPLLTNTLALVDDVRAGFGSCQMFVFENDSTDDTALALDSHAARNEWFHVRHDTWGGLDQRGFEPERTVRLAKARNICLEWVLVNGSRNQYTIVVDLDPAYGFSVDGVFNSIGWLGDLAAGSPSNPAAMASYSLYRITHENGNSSVAQYDSWAARQNWWRDRRDEPGGMAWFSLLLPPVGSPPIPMNSAFGGLCVYRTDAYLSGGYSGEDCEHVPHHRRMAEAGWQLYLNPGCRYIAVWK